MIRSLKWAPQTLHVPEDVCCVKLKFELVSPAGQPWSLNPTFYLYRHMKRARAAKTPLLQAEVKLPPYLENAKGINMGKQN